MANELNDLIELLNHENSDKEQLLKDAYVLGLRRGIEYAKQKVIEAIQQEK